MKTLHLAALAATLCAAVVAPDVYDELRAVAAGQDAQLADHEARITALERATVPAGPSESDGEWYDFDTGGEITPETTKPAFRPDDQPDGSGVTFFIDDVLNREDPTPNPYQIHPFVAHPEGTVFRAEWTDSSGVERVSEHTVEGSVVVVPPGPDPDPPTLDGRPTRETVGYLGDWGSLTPSGTVTLDSSSSVVEGLRITGSVLVKGPGTIRNCVIDQSSYYGIRANYGRHAVLVEDCTIMGSSSAGVLGYDVTMRRCAIYDHGGDGMKPYSGWLVEDCYVADLGSNEGAHADGVQFVSGGDCTFRRCNFDMPIPPPAPYKSNAAFFISTNNGPISNVTIEDCWLNGGNYTVYIIDKGNGHGLPTGCVVRNNRFGRDYRYGYWRNQSSSTVVEGNVWDDTGELMSIND